MLDDKCWRRRRTVRFQSFQDGLHPALDFKGEIVFAESSKLLLDPGAKVQQLGGSLLTDCEFVVVEAGQQGT